ncbi:MAG: alpha/beta hydrolase [Chloroflexota bacterium]|nr:MAG: alpha/beta hydrolase [Chloroflexota bacterium]
MKKLICLFLMVLFATACMPSDVKTEDAGLIPTLADTSTPTILPTDTSVPSATGTLTPTRTASPTPDSENGVVKFPAEDGLTIVGTQFGQGEVAVILAHMGEAGSNTRASWSPFARYIATTGEFTALAIDLRGYGNTGGMRKHGEQYLDVLAAIDFLKAQGFEKIVCMGASMGGNACAEAALAYPDMDGLAIIASKPRLDRDYSQLSMPKLFVLEEGDPYFLAPTMEALYEMVPEPKSYHTFPEQVHGTRMFETASGDDFRQLLVDFLKSIDR